MNRRSKNADGNKKNSSVGYGKPPIASQFKPGISGNPRGRPRGSKNRPRSIDLEPLKAILTEEAYRPIKVREGERVATIPVVRAIVRTMSTAALKGSFRSQEAFLKAVSSKETDEADRRNRTLDAAFEYKDNWREELARRTQLNETGPEPVPHPDHLTIHVASDTVVLNGPLTADDKKAWDFVKDGLQGMQQDIADLERLVASDPDDGNYAEKLILANRRYQRIAGKIPKSLKSYFVGSS